MKDVESSSLSVLSVVSAVARGTRRIAASGESWVLAATERSLAAVAWLVSHALACAMGPIEFTIIEMVTSTAMRFLQKGPALIGFSSGE